MPAAGGTDEPMIWERMTSAEIGAVVLALQRALEAAVTNNVKQLRLELQAEITERERLSEKVTFLESAVLEQLRQEDPNETRTPPGVRTVAQEPVTEAPAGDTERANGGATTSHNDTVQGAEIQGGGGSYHGKAPEVHAPPIAPRPSQESPTNSGLPVKPPPPGFPVKKLVEPPEVEGLDGAQTTHAVKAKAALSSKKPPPPLPQSAAPPKPPPAPPLPGHPATSPTWSGSPPEVGLAKWCPSPAPSVTTPPQW